MVAQGDFVGCYFLISTSFTVDPEMMLLVALALKISGKILGLWRIIHLIIRMKIVERIFIMISLPWNGGWVFFMLSVIL